MRSQYIALFISILSVSGTLTTPAAAQSTAPHPATVPTQHAPRAHGELVIVLTSGMEDIQAMNMAFRQARAAADLHQLTSVTVLVYGRGVQALNGGMPARPPQTAQFARDALAAGVRIVVCANALQQMGVAAEQLDPHPTEVVANATTTLVEFATRGATVIRY